MIRKILLDTSVYGRIIEKNEVELIRDFSEDERTMFGRDAIRAYKLVNNIEKLSIPKFIDYGELKKKLRSSDFNKFLNSFSKFGIFYVFFILIPYFFMSLFFCFHVKIHFMEYINVSEGVEDEK